ncbi:hypothetical protein FC70_GL000871 [Paucilactobacillus oligofermentans DSM 15707 = LMG 22743]|uniref:HTH marR-type domain-containing protein n=1 Tax=Paucilactobacillus oligofermentans DSM 15707 = LMG 22743 TaxID=1423778 RepID=A0A0R1RPE9_9LACO|nr:MarR family transcriptional regulator [Paucilactobacillus oligofermentans]KRL55275.1 hypothetical protein FC70_GL000871 [Paucilactobacillus oligofermentans DSM 15707 = LMG 22743]CUS25734.1 MarR family transcriptional regulator [Paucilactobacillus oligofermentans DSM 15707 = LMG 22743]
MPNIMDSGFKAISILYRKSHIWLNEGCAQYSLTAAQALVISIVCDFGMLTQDGITKRLGLDKSVVAKTVLKLEETGYMTRTKNAKDKRTYDIQPTNKALAVYPSVKKEVDICFQRMTETMTTSGRDDFKRLLLVAANLAVELDD